MPLTRLGPTDPAAIGPFTLTGRLGTGGMGVVYHGTDARENAVAIKVMAPGVAADVRQRMHQEAQLLARVHHPCIPRLVAADLTADPPWLAMTYVPGPGLHQAQVPLEEVPLRQLARGLAGALAALHAVGVVHRDVKPSNIILTHDGPALVDLGIARSEDHAPLTQTGLVVGSPGWMSPEQLLDRPVGPWTDVWSWAAVLTYAATGRQPFGTGPAEAVGWRLLHAEPDLSGVPGWLRPDVAAAFARDPGARPRAEDLMTRFDDRSSRPVEPLWAWSGGPATTAWSGNPTVASGDAPPAAGGTPPAAPGRTPLVPVPRGGDNEARARPRPLRTLALLAVLAGVGGIVGLLALRLAADPSSPAPSSTGTVRAASDSQTSGASPASSRYWSSSTDELRALSRRLVALPAFPAAVTGFRLQRSWSETFRVAAGRDWSTLPGFPASTSDCARQRFLVRWRDVSTGPGLEANFVSVPDQNLKDTTVHGVSGWQSGGGCGEPAFRLSGGVSATVVVEAEEWAAV